MKKILLLGFTLIMSFYSINSNAQTISSITITSPILCYGDFANINIQISQTIPPTISKVMIGYYIGNWFIPITSTNNTTVTNINIPALAAQTYTILLVDSIPYYATNPNGTNPASIYDSSGINITQPLQLTNTANQTSVLLCNGDCDADVLVNVFGGTTPYSISFGGGTNTTLSISTFDSTYTNLCAGTYAIAVTDANSCSVSGSSPTSITISEPPPLTPNGSVTSDYNGEDISCFGAADGEITGAVTGGTLPYTYSLDGITYGSSAILSGLSAETFTLIIRFSFTGFLLISKYLYFILSPSPPSVSFSIVKGGVFDEFRIVSSDTFISISPVGMFIFFELRSITSPLTWITNSLPSFLTFSHKSELLSILNAS